MIFFSLPLCVSGENDCLLSADSRNGNRARLSFSILKPVIYTRLFRQGTSDISLRMAGAGGHFAVAAWIGVIQQTVIEVSV